MMKWCLPVLLCVFGFLGSRELSQRVSDHDAGIARGDAPGESRVARPGGKSSLRPVDHDPSAEYWRRFREIEMGRLGPEAGQAFFMDWFRDDPDAALDALRRSRRFSQKMLLGILFEDDVEALQAMGERLDDIILVGSWHEPGFGGDIDRSFNFAVGKSLVDKVRSLPETYARKDLLNYAMAGWLYRDWKEATRWAGGLSDEERLAAGRAFLSERIPSRVAKDKEALQWMREVLTEEGNRDLLVKQGPSLMYEMAAGDPLGALSWAEEHLSGSAYSKAVKLVVQRSFSSSPAMAEKIVDELPPGTVREQAARGLVTKMQRKNALGAYQRAMKEEEMNMNMGVQAWLQLGRSLGQQNPAEVRRILSESQGPSRAFATYAMEEVYWREPEVTRRWAEEMQGERRKEAIEHVYRAWHLRKPEEAKEWRAEVE